jgi:hypothetical protein
MSEKRFFVVIDDRLWKSAARDLISCCSLLVAVAVGVVVDSSALQWIGGLMWVLWFFARTSRDVKNKTYGTIAEARAALDELEES